MTMKKLILLSLTLAGVAGATEPTPHELTIEHVPLNIEIIKTCGSVTQKQMTNIVNKDDASGSFHSEMSMSSASITMTNSDASKSQDCTLTLRTSTPCTAKDCKQVIDFSAKKP